jgi:phage baseplate assembly protein W
MASGYGITIKVDENDNDFKFNPDTNRLVLVQDEQNALQAIRILLHTIKGEVRFFPDFGIDIPILMDKNISTENLKHAVNDALKRDPRVKTIDSIIIERKPADRVLNIYVALTTFRGAILEIKEDVIW